MSNTASGYIPGPADDESIYALADMLEKGRNVDEDNDDFDDEQTDDTGIDKPDEDKDSDAPDTAAAVDVDSEADDGLVYRDDDDYSEEDDDNPHFAVQDWVEDNLIEGRVELPDGTELLEEFVKYKGFEVREAQYTVVDETLERFFDADAREGDGIFDGSLTAGVDKTINAPVATGKSLAAMLIAIGSGQRLVLASSKKSLQVQYLTKDIPEVADFLKEKYGYELTFGMMKGQYDYANLTNLRAALDGTSEFEVFQNLDDGTRGIIEDIVSRSEKGLAEVAETSRMSDFLDVGFLISMLPKNMQRLASAASPGAKPNGFSYWAKLYSLTPDDIEPGTGLDSVAESLAGVLRGPNFSMVVDDSPYLTAYMCAVVSDIVVVNHHLLAFDLMRASNTSAASQHYTTPNMIRGAGWIIVDEAQHYPATLTQVLSKEFSLARYADELERAANRLDSAGFEGTWIPERVDEMADLVEEAHNKIDGALEEQDNGTMIPDADTIIAVLSNLRQELAKRAHLLSTISTLSLGKALAEGQSKGNAGAMSQVGEAAAIADLNDKKSKVSKAWSKTIDGIYESVVTPLGEFNPSDMWDVAVSRDTFVPSGGNNDDVNWIVHLTPLDIRTHRGHILEVQREPNIYSLVLGQKLWNGIFGTGMALMSGTLSELVGPKIGMASDNDEYLSVDSPMDCRQVRYCVPSDMPEPSWQNKDRWLAEAVSKVVEAVKTTRGRTMILSTSKDAMNAYAAALRKQVPEVDVIVQGDADQQTVIDKFKLSEHGVLLGVNSFWEGVDVPGDDLLLVIMDKLMFPRMDDPIYKALAKAEKMAGGDDFMNVTIDHVAFMFAQGAGRLQRSESDFGGVLILDPRINTKRYGGRCVSLAPKDSPLTRNWDRFLRYMGKVADSVDNGTERPGLVTPTDDGDHNWIRLAEAGPAGAGRKRRSSGSGKRRFD